MLNSYERNKFKTTPEKEKQIEVFLDKYFIQRKLKGYNYFKDMIIYVLNDYQEKYNIKKSIELYKICAEYENTTMYNIRRLCEYAGGEFFSRKNSENHYETPYKLILKALHEIEFKEEYKGAYKKY